VYDGTVRDHEASGTVDSQRRLQRGERAVNIFSAQTRGDPLIVLIPSPLLGPYSWSLVGEELSARGWEVLVSVDLRDPLGGEPGWRQTTGGAAASLRAVPSDRSVALIGHSNAGPLLPAVGSSLPQPIVAYLFVDARLPHGGMSRLDAIEAEDPDGAAQRRADLAAGRRYPAWTDEELRELIPDAERRRALLAELRPRGAGYWTELLPTISGWPDAPCGYLQFSAPYRSAADRARRVGWPTHHLPAGHFHQLVDPSAGVAALAGLLAETGVPSPGSVTPALQKGATT